MSRKCRLPVLAMLCAATFAGRAPAHETDQFTLPAGREFADLGPHLNNWAYEAIERGVRKVNARIGRALAEGRRGAALQELQSPNELARAVNSEFPDAYNLIEGMEVLLKSEAMKRKYPGLLVGYERQFGNIYQHVHFPLDPRQFFRIWHATTFKAYGSYFGTDKIGHFVDMGMHYWKAYSDARREGASESLAVRRAVEVGTHGPIFSERGMVGYLSAGAYSNADLAANYLGFLFYKNLAAPAMLKGQERPPMVEREGNYWRVAPHVRRDSQFFALFVSDHYNEALNPSHFEDSMRQEIRKAIRKRTEIVLDRYADEHGNPRSREYLDAAVREHRTYYGQEYGYRGPPGEMVTVANSCFETLPSTAEPSKRDLRGHTPLHQAAANGDIFELKRLIDLGADVNAIVRSDEGYSAEWGDTPLHSAAREGRIEAVEFLLGARANPNLHNFRGQTPLHHALGQPQIVGLLLEHHASADAHDLEGQTPLHWAAQDGNVETADLLLSNGANPGAADHRGCTPLHVACRYGRSAIAAALLDRGAHANGASAYGTSPLLLAARHGDPALVDLMITRGCEVEVRDEFGRTPLHEAAHRGHEEAAALLCAQREVVDAPDDRGNTPLHVAAREGRAGVAATLLTAGAKVNAQNDVGATPLHHAALSDEPKMVAKLLEHGADGRIRNAFGQTALDLATSRAHHEIAALLRNGRQVAVGAR